MDYIPRSCQDLESYLEPNRVLLLFGPRRVGKTTLIERYLGTTKWKYLLVSGDNIQVQDVLGSQDFDRIKEFCAGYELIVIDEAQNVPNIGMGLKIIVDQIKPIRVIATGSSSFDLARQVGEPLVGRKKNLYLYPLSQMELAGRFNPYDLKMSLPSYLIYGSYPDVLNQTTDAGRQGYLLDLVGSYLLKDIFALEQVRSPQILMKLLKLLAFQVGSEVSHTELAQQLEVDVKTAGRYLWLLEQTFIIYRLGGFSRNLRKELSSKPKYYFYDNGVRNAVISSFNPLDSRNDQGALWENFLISERIKYQTYQNLYTSNYFWRTYDQQEIDWIEERNGKIHAYEFKWGSATAKVPAIFQSTYPEASFEVINGDNYLKFIT